MLSQNILTILILQFNYKTIKCHIPYYIQGYTVCIIHKYLIGRKNSKRQVGILF